MNTDKNIINGVYCQVTNCSYHTVDNKCTAGRIQVSPCRDSKCEPDCATFKEKSGIK